MRRGVLLVAGGKLPRATVERIAAWWRSDQEGLCVIDCDDVDARMVLVDLDGRVLGDTDGGPPVVVINARSPEEVRASVEGALRLGATGESLGEVLRLVEERDRG